MKTFSNIHPSDRIPIMRTTYNSRKSRFSVLPILNSIHMNWYVKWVFTNCLSKYSITKSAYIALNKTEVLPVPIHGIHVSIHLIQPQFISLCITLLMPTNHHIFTHGNRNLNKPSKPKNMNFTAPSAATTRPKPECLLDMTRLAAGGCVTLRDAWHSWRSRDCNDDG